MDFDDSKVLMIPKCTNDIKVISDGSHDFDNPKAYGDISISDGLVSREVIPYI